MRSPAATWQWSASRSIAARLTGQRPLRSGRGPPGIPAAAPLEPGPGGGTVRRAAGGGCRRHRCNPFDIKEAVDQIEAAAAALLGDAGRLLAIGGDHTIAYPLLRVTRRRFGPVGILRGLAGLRLVGADVVEVAPAYDHAEVTTVAAAHVCYELLGLMALGG
jgi:arginase family enzyme